MENAAAEKSLAFERRGGRLKVLLEEGVPSVRLNGRAYFVTEAASVLAGGKKYFVEGVF